MYKINKVAGNEIVGKSRKICLVSGGVIDGQTGIKNRETYS